MFIEEGWRGVEMEFGSRTDCNKRWVEECGGDQLKRERKEFLQQRSERLRLSRLARAAKPKPLPIQISQDLQSAIEFLRSPEGGSWQITPTGRGDFYFGATRLPGNQIVARAKGLRGRNMPWSDAEREVLSEDFTSAPLDAIGAALPNRSKRQILSMAYNLGLRRGL